MRYHDFHLRGYTVAESGRKITLDLVYDYPGHSHERSLIEFADVACYRFVHSEGAIITDINEVPLDALVKQEEAFLTATAAAQGLSFWTVNLETYCEQLTKERYRAWRIDSAVGFTGFVIAKQLNPKSANHTLLATPLRGAPELCRWATQ